MQKLFSKSINEKFNVSSRKNTNISEVKIKDIIKTYNIYNSSIVVEIKGAKFGVLDNQEFLLDEQSVEERIRELLNIFVKTSTKYNPIPKKIVIDNNTFNGDMNKSEYSDKKKEEVEKDIVNVYNPKWSMEDVYIEESIKEEIITSLAIEKYKKILFDEWGIKGDKGNGRAVCLNFWGPPGTGKSMTAEAIANYLNKKLLVVNYSELESKYVGETPKNIKKVFNIARENDAIIVFDEADSFLGKRLTNVMQSADYGVNITRSIMLMELENYDGVVVFTTNLLANYDEAFKRRIFANIEFKLPDEIGRQVIWKSHLSNAMPISEGLNAEKLAQLFNGISGADIKDIIILAATKCLREKRTVVELSDFIYSYNVVIKRYKSESISIKTEQISEEEFIKEAKNSIH